MTGQYSFAAFDSRPRNGIAKVRKMRAYVTSFHGAMSRSRMKCVSSPRLPYQMTRYWLNVR